MRPYVPSPFLSRRHFLKAALATAGVTFLASCSRGQPAASTAANPGSLDGRPFVAPPDRPSVAGTLGSVDNGALTLEAPLGSRIFALPDSVHSAAGGKMGALPQGSSLALWLHGEEIIALQELPAMAALNEFPEKPAQPAPTGETRPFGPLTLITRAGWGAAAAPQWSAQGEAGLFDEVNNPAGWLEYPGPLASWLTTLVVHHTALAFYHGPRVIQRLHISERHFADVGYHFLIDGLGQLYEGRPLGVRGAHTGGHNTGTVGVGLLGNFSIVEPVRAQLDTLQQLADTLREQYQITHLAGHRDFQPDATDCPGDHLASLLPALAEATSLSYSTDGYRPPPWASRGSREQWPRAQESAPAT